ncbi:hypothetical protein EV126DRAFT_420223 [Verticillium dahliae]|nr:hypothetical protein EV126DRAFT_435804 [Verticillium dahliae]KAH6701922.1 hypothetical protein EV126DRAFT_420223 [Verticillium dahliae]
MPISRPIIHPLIAIGFLARSLSTLTTFQGPRRLFVLRSFPLHHRLCLGAEVTDFAPPCTMVTPTPNLTLVHPVIVWSYDEDDDCDTVFRCCK